MKEEQTIQLVNQLTEIQRVSEVVEELGDRHDVPMKVVFAMTLALDEIITNIVSYGYSDENEHQITVRIALDEECLSVEIEDDAKEFNPLEKEEADTTLDIEEREIGGLGIHLIRKTMDTVEYRYADGHNILLLKKKLG